MKNPMPGDSIGYLKVIGAKTQFGQSGRIVCGAKAKRTGLPCQQPSMKNGRCRLHGGKTPKRGDIKLPKTRLELRKWLCRLARKEHFQEKTELRKNPPPINWYLEQDLWSMGLMSKLQTEVERYELREAYKLYYNGEAPWIAWQQALDRLGLWPLGN